MLLSAACSSDPDPVPPGVAGAGGGVGGSGGGETVGGAGGSGGSTPSKCDTPADAPLSDPMVHLGRADGPSFIEILDVVQDHPIIYACTSVKGFNVWDASGDGPPTSLATGMAPPGLAGGENGQLPHCQHVGLDSANAVVAITNRGDEIQPQPFIAVADVSDPSNVSGNAVWQGPESIEGVVIAGDRIYAAAHNDGIIVFNYDGSSITEVGRYSDDDSDAWFPYLDGDYLYVAEGARGFTVYDVSSDEPSLVTTVAIDGSSKDIVVADGVAYVAASSRVAAIDVSDPANATALGEVLTTGTAVALALGVNQTVLVAEWEKVRGYDISDPANMKQELSEVLPTTGGAAFSRTLTVDAAPDVGRAYPGEWSGLHAYTQTACGVGPDIEATPDQVSFPTVEPNESEVRAIVINNNGNRPLTISDISSNDAALTVSETSLTVDANSGGAIEVTFSPTSGQELSGLLTFTSDDIDQSPFVIDISGNVPGIDVGDPLPDFNLVDTEGQNWSNSDLDGKVAVFAYFATF